MTKLTAAFRNFVNAPTKVILNIDNATLVNNGQQTKGSPAPIHKQYMRHIYNHNFMLDTN